MKRIFPYILLTIMFFCSIATYAYDFEVDGIYYNVLDLKEKTVEVTHSDAGKSSMTVYVLRSGYSSVQAAKVSTFQSNYQGTIKIPREVEYNGHSFLVRKIGAYAFTGQSDITTITIPSSVIEISSCISENKIYNLKEVGNVSYTNICPFAGCRKLSEICIGRAYMLDYFACDDKFEDYQIANTTYYKYMYDDIKIITLLDDFDEKITTQMSIFNKLEKLCALANTPPVLSDNCFSNAQLMNLPVYVPEENYEAYQQADVWKDFWKLKAMKSAKSISLDTEEIELKPEETCQLRATVLPEDAFNKEVIWTSSNSEIVEVDSTGLIVGKGKGDAIVTVKTTDGTDLSAFCSVHVDCLVESIELNTKKLLLEPSQSAQLSATILPSVAFVKDVAWRSTDERIVSVDLQGKVTAKALGKTKIIATTTDGSSLSDTCEIMVANLSSIYIGGLYFKVETSGAVVIPSPYGVAYKGAIEIPSRIEIPDLGTINVSSIATDAFYKANELTKIALPASITNIGERAFSGCSSLEFIRIENASLLSANLDELFADSKVEELYLGADNVTFNENSKLLSGLKSIVIGNSVKSLPNVSVCSKNLERFVVEDGENKILEPDDYCEESYKQTYCNTIRSNYVYYRYGYLVTIYHLKPIADLVENKTIKYIYFGREIDGKMVNKPSSETKPTSAGSRYQEYGYKDEYNYQYAEYIAKTDYEEVELKSIKFSKEKIYLEMGETIQLTPNPNPNAVPFTNVYEWSSSDENVATVNIFGMITIVGQGEATIMARTVDGTQLSAFCLVICDPNKVGVHDIELGTTQGCVVFNIDGVCNLKAIRKSELNNLPKGIYIVNGRKTIVK